MQGQAFGVVLAAMGPYLALVPQLVVLIIAAVLAISRWQRHPGVSKLVLAFVLVDVTLLVAGTWINFTLPGLILDRGYETRVLGTVFAIVGIVQSILRAAALALLVGAAFGWRGQVYPPPVR